MFTFTGRIARRAFFWGSVLRIGLFVASVIGFPFVLLALVSLTGCQRVGGACGAVGLIGAMAYKPLVFILFVVSFVGLAMRRANDAGLPAWTGLLIPLLLCADRNFLVFFGAPWSFAFSSGALFSTFPIYALLALACIGILCVLPTRSGGTASGNPFGTSGWVAFGFGLFVAVSAAMKALLTFPALLPLLSPIRGVGWPLRYAPYAMVGLVASLIWIAWRERGYVAPASAFSESGPPRTSGIATMLLLACAFGLATAAIMVAFGDSFQPLVLLVQATTIVLPTMLLYFCVMLGAYLVVTRRNVGSAALLVVALMPFAAWGYSDWQTSREAAREAAEVAAIPTASASRVPRTMVIESDNFAGRRAVWQVPGIDHVIHKSTNGSRHVQFDRPTGRGRNEEQVVNTLPEEYLLLRVGQSSPFAGKLKKNHARAAEGGPFELRLVDADGDRLIGIYYHSLHARPTFPPVLSEQGWFREPNTTTDEKLTARISGFINQSLRSAAASAIEQNKVAVK